MTNIDNFKQFVKDNPSLVNYVRNNEMTWQKFYELYDLYGEDNNVWDDYLKKESEKPKTTTGMPSSWGDLVKMAKNVDTNKVQEGITSLQKAIGLFGDLFVNKDTTTSTNSYKPRPLYRSFED